MIDVAIEIMRMTESDIMLLQKTIQSSDIVSMVDARMADFIHSGYIAEIFMFDEACQNSLTVCFRAENSRYAIELECPKSVGLKSLCERSNFLNEYGSTYSIIDRKLLSKIMTKEVVHRLHEKIHDRTSEA